MPKDYEPNMVAQHVNKLRDKHTSDIKSFGKSIDRIFHEDNARVRLSRRLKKGCIFPRSYTPQVQ